MLKYLRPHNLLPEQSRAASIRWARAPREMPVLTLTTVCLLPALGCSCVPSLCNTSPALRSSIVCAVLNFLMDVVTLPCATLVVPDQQSTRQQSTRQQPYPALLACAHAVFSLVICAPSLVRRLRRSLSSLSKQWGCRH